MSGTVPVAFDYSIWTARYPEFSDTVSEQLGQLYFTEAQLYVDNTGLGPVVDAPTLTLLLNMMTAHIAALNQPGSSSLVGRISDASEGSVHVAVEFATPMTGSMAWFAQTKYGIAFWQATAQYRKFQYQPGPQCAPMGYVPWR